MIEPLAYSIGGAATATSLSPTYIKQAISGGRLRARKAGRRTVITRVDLERWLDALPATP